MEPNIFDFKITSTTTNKTSIPYEVTARKKSDSTLDDSVVKLVRDKGIYLEMCPTSNRMTYAISDMSNYPLIDYLKKGIKVTLNTDDMAIEGITLADEYRYMEREFGLTTDQKKVMLENSVNAAFTSEEVKKELRKELT